MRYLNLLVLMVILTACASGPPTEARFSWEFYRHPKITPASFVNQKVAILPTVNIQYDPFQEVYRETLAGLLYVALSKNTEGPKILPLDVVQSAINKNDLGNDFRAMYKEYQETSILRKDILAKLGKAVGARYVLLPRLLRFQSETFERVSIVGISFLRTRESSVDLHGDLWDTETGEAVWQGASEGTLASEVVRGRAASFMAVAMNACESFAGQMPWVKKQAIKESPK